MRPDRLALRLHDPPPPICQLSTSFRGTPNTVVTPSRSRPATNAATTRSRRASGADGDRCRLSHTRNQKPNGLWSIARS